MKSKFSLLAVVALATSCFVSSSCGSFTKDDLKEAAQDIGAVIVKDSLATAGQVMAGQTVDYKLAATQLGLKVANLAIAKASASLSRPASGASADVSGISPNDLVAAESERIVNEALSHAQKQLSAGDNPAAASLAQLVAVGGAEAAISALDSPPGGKTALSYLPAL